MVHTFGNPLGKYGMASGEVVRRARDWWNSTGRGLVPLEFNREIFEKTLSAPNLRSKSEGRTLNSGILNGVRWDDLNDAEKTQVALQWLQNHVDPIDDEEKDPRLARKMELKCDHFLHDINEQDEVTIMGPDDENCFKQALHLGWYLSDEFDACPDCHARYFPSPDTLDA